MLSALPAAPNGRPDAPIGRPDAAPAPPRPSPPESAAQGRLREAATALEAGFLKEMLQAAGLGRVPGLGGGPGEEQFASFLLDAQARRIAEAGGIGLAGSIVAAMARDAGPGSLQGEPGHG